MVLIATGSEVKLALDAQAALKAEGIAARVVSMPCADAFDRQDADYRASVLGKCQKRVAIEAGHPDIWHKYVGLRAPSSASTALANRPRPAAVRVLRFHRGQCRRHSENISNPHPSICNSVLSGVRAMGIKVAINGFGRIGRCTLRAIYEQGLQNEFEVVAINASGDLATNAHLLKYDTTHGRFRTSVETEGENCIIIDGKKIAFYSTKDPKGVNWAAHGVDVLLECTGAYTTKAKAQALLDQGAKRVLISAPGGDDVDTTIVMG